MDKSQGSGRARPGRPSFEEESDRQQRIAAWAEDQLDPDNWLEIPEFGVAPADVDFKGFAHPIVHPESPEFAQSVRTLVQIVRSLARKEFETLAELNEANARAWDVVKSREPERPLTSAERTAFSYRLALWNFQKVFAPPDYVWDGYEAEELASRGAFIAHWAHEGAEAAMKRISEQNRVNASGDRARVTKEMVADFARRQGYPGKCTWEAFIQTGAAAFHTSTSTIRRRYEAAKTAGLLP